MGGNAGVPSAALDTEELVRRLSGITLIGDKFTAELQKAAVGEHCGVGRRLPDGKFRHIGVRGKRRGEREAAHFVESRVCDRGRVTALEPDMGMQGVNAGNDAGGFHLGEHFSERLLAFRVFVAEIIIAAERPRPDFLDDIAVAERKVFEAALLHIRKKFVDILRRNSSAGMEDGGIDVLRTAALDTARKIVVLLDPLHRVQKSLASRSGDESGACATQFEAAHKIGGENFVSLALFMIDIGILGSSDHADSRLLVPACVEPVAEVLAVQDRKLDYAETLHRRNVHAQIVIGFRTVGRKIHEFESDVAGCRFNRDFRLVHLVGEAGDERIAFTTERIRRIGGTLVGIDELHFVVERTVLGRGHKSDIFIAAHALHTSLLDDE